MISRRRFITIVASCSATSLVGGKLLAEGSTRTLFPVRWQGIVLGTEAQIQIHSFDEDHARAVLKRCLQRIRDLEQQFTLYDELSLISQLNRNGELAAATPDFIDILKHARRHSDLTEGVFDITIQGRLSSKSQSSDSRVCDYRSVLINGDTVSFAKSGMAITLNGIGQGYITDKVAQILEAEGITNTLVELGEKRAIGGHPSGRPWHIGIEDPFDEGAIRHTENIENQAIATSGDYRQRSHLLRPFGEKPSEEDLASVSVIANNATQADALSTACFLMSRKEIDRLRQRLESPIKIVGITPSGRVEIL